MDSAPSLSQRASRLAHGAIVLMIVSLLVGILVWPVERATRPSDAERLAVVMSLRKERSPPRAYPGALGIDTTPRGHWRPFALAGDTRSATSPHRILLLCSDIFALLGLGLLLTAGFRAFSRPTVLAFSLLALLALWLHELAALARFLW